MKARAAAVVSAKTIVLEVWTVALEAGGWRLRCRRRSMRCWRRFPSRLPACRVML
jgi:hypothetical protein